MPLRLLVPLLLLPTLAFAHGHAEAQVETAPVAREAHPAQDADVHQGAPHAGHAPAASTPAADDLLPAGAPWPADEPLSRGMARVRAATQTLGHAAHGHLDPAQVRGIADELRSATRMMFDECRLPPAPDAALHPLLAAVLDAAGALDHGFDADALASLQAVVARYPRLFVDAAWSESQSD